MLLLYQLINLLKIIINDMAQLHRVFELMGLLWVFLPVLFVQQFLNDNRQYLLLIKADYKYILRRGLVKEV